MKALELFEYLAANARYSQGELNSLLEDHDDVVLEALSKSDSQLMREYLSNGVRMADKTTIFQV